MIRVGTRPEGLSLAFRAEGRMEKRIGLAVRLELCKDLDPTITVSAITENACSCGVRVITRSRLKLNERVMVSPPASHLHTPATVVYCQPLPGGRFGIGLRFQKAADNLALAAGGAAGDD